jgi:hypothetical protein
MWQKPELDTQGSTIRRKPVSKSQAVGQLSELQGTVPLFELKGAETGTIPPSTGNTAMQPT